MTKTQEVFNRAKEAGKVSEREDWLKLGEKKEGGGVKPTGPHRVIFKDDKITMGRDYHTREERKEMKYTFEEDGAEKFYSVPLFNSEGNVHYVIEKMKDFNYGDKIKMEMKWVGDKHVIDIQRVYGEEENKTDSSRTDYDDVPVVEEEDKGIDTDEIPF